MERGEPTIRQLVFQTGVSRHKPFTINAQDSACPFCDRSQLPPLIKEDGDILLVPNKYPILKNTTPLVLIETADCQSELSLYPRERLLRVFRMGFESWREMLADSRFRSVLFLKNHGPLSGGSLRHPHMQLIGLWDVDYQPNISLRDFSGPIIHEETGVRLTLSGEPRIGYTEFNLILADSGAFDAFCILVQKTVQYLLWRFHDGRTTSYNLFFYALGGAVYCKVMPRYATTPVFIGYAIPQVTDNLEAVAEDFRQNCFSPEWESHLVGGAHV